VQRRIEKTYCEEMEASKERVPPGRQVGAMERGRQLYVSR